MLVIYHLPELLETLRPFLGEPMNYLSFNVHGIGRGPKRDTLKQLLDNVCPIVVLLQETMSSGATACDFFLKLCPGRL